MYVIKYHNNLNVNIWNIIHTYLSIVSYFSIPAAYRTPWYPFSFVLLESTYSSILCYRSHWPSEVPYGNSQGYSNEKRRYWIAIYNNNDDDEIRLNEVVSYTIHGWKTLQDNIKRTPTSTARLDPGGTNDKRRIVGKSSEEEEPSGVQGTRKIEA